MKPLWKRIQGSISNSSFFSRSSIAHQLLWVILITASAASFLAVLAGIQLETTNEKLSVQRTLEEAQYSHVPILVTALWEANDALFEGELESILIHPNHKYVEVTLSDGKKISKGQKPLVDALVLQKTYSLEKEFNGRIQKLGTLVIVARVGYFWERIGGITSFAIVGTVISILLVCFIFLIAFEQLVGQHLRNLTHHVSQMDLEQLDVPFTLNRPSSEDEIALLERAYNQMRQHLVRSTTDLRESNLLLLEEIEDRKKIEMHLREVEEKIRIMNNSLNQRVAEQTSELWAANNALARAARLKDEFLTNISHELRTPLTGMLGISESMEHEIYGELTERQVKALQDIQNSGQHLLELINDILDVSKIESGKEELNIEPVMVEEICQSSLQALRQEILAKNLRCSFLMDHSIQQLLVDKSKLQKILINLLSNAVKFTPKNGKIGLEVDSNATDKHVKFTVWDTGIGISEQDFPHIFEPFVQVNKGLNRQYSGTGLGLSLVHHLVHLMGGQISVESTLHKGSRFVVTLPWFEGLNGVETDHHLELNDSLYPLPKPHPSAPLILIADDEPITRKTLNDFIQSLGYRTVLACDGESARDIALEMTPDLILIDIRMPTIDGLEVIRILRTHQQLQNTPILALSAMVRSKDREECITAGATDFISKPVSLDFLSNIIKEQIPVL